MGYVLYDNLRKAYVKKEINGILSATFKRPHAYVWDDEIKARNVINCLPHTLTNLYDFKVTIVDEYHEGEDYEICLSERKPYAYDNSEYIPNKFDINKEINNMFEFISTLENRRDYLIEQVRNCELKLNDINHAAEFLSLDACQGYKLYKLLHSIRIERRECKNELIKINKILGTRLESAELSRLNREVEWVDNEQYYSPRILSELFVRYDKIRLDA